MFEKKDGKIINFIFEFLIIFLMIFLVLLLILYYLGIDAEDVVINGINLQSFKKQVDDNEIDDYIQNDLILEDDNLNISTYTENNYFYNQLDDYGKLIYDKIVDNSENLKSGDYTINFSNEFNSLLNNNGEEVLKASYRNAIDCIRYDRLGLFYIDFTKMYMKIEITTRNNVNSYSVYIEKSDDYLNYYIDGIENEQSLNYIMKSIDERKSEILNNISGTNYQKILQIHNYLIDNLQYDETYNRQNNDNIIGAFLDGNVVCEGYAKAFKYLLDDLEIPCILVIGDAVNSEGTREKHMWNYVLINEEWYAVDVTWDDPILIGSGTLSEESRYKYFCRKSDFNDNHFSEGVISVNGTEFKYPSLVE